MSFVCRTILALVCFAACAVTLTAQLYNVSGSVLGSTLLIKTVNGQGTGFTINVDRRQYLITARHLVENMGAEGVVEVAKFDAQRNVAHDSYTMKIFRCSGEVDIAVLVPPVRLTIGDSMELSQGFIFGQNAYFVGFPFGTYSTPGGVQGPLMIPHPVGLIKQGLISGVQDNGLLLLDGFNVFGFSGSPVTFGSLPSGSEPAHTYVIAVISGFTPDFGPVLVPRKIRPQDIKQEDRARGRIVELPDHPGEIYVLEEKKMEGVKTNEMVQLNTGIVRSYLIGPAIDLIKEHPIGVPVN